MFNDESYKRFQEQEVFTENPIKDEKNQKDTILSILSTLAKQDTLIERL